MGRGGDPESNDRDATGPRPIRTSTCVLDDQGRGEVWGRRLVAVAVMAWNRTQRSSKTAKHATKEAAKFMSGPTRAARWMLKRLCKYYSEAPALSWTFPSPDRRHVDLSMLVIICRRRIRRHSRLWRCQLESQYIFDHEGVQPMLWRSAVP